MSNVQDNCDSFAKQIKENIGSTNKASTVLKTDQKVLARITDGIYRHVYSAIRELICNSYDADAEKVYVDTDCPRFNQITVRDDGNGMSEEVLSNLLHHIGGSAKRNYKQKDLGIFAENDPTLSPIKQRKLIGKIGIGLFSVAQLTRDFTIITKQAGKDYYLVADIKLKNFSEEQIQKIEERGADFETGTVDVYTTPAENIDAHGTDIIIRNLKRSAIDQLKSVNIWNQTTTDDDDDINSIINEIKPAFHIGEIDDENNIIKEKANLPWKNTESSREKFISLYQNLVDLQTNDKYPSIEKNLDSYLKMLWILGLSLPVEYISDSPEELSSDECKYVYEIQNNEKASKKVDTNGKYGDILNLHSSIGNDFKVFVDDVQILRPIKFIEETKTDAQFKDNIIFYGKFEPDLSALDPETTGGKLKLEAIIKWAPRIVPKEHVGVSIRINGASGALFDPEFMNWQLAEYMLKKQMTIEINILEGFESALNIDRESFNFAHPHYQLVMRWLHKALRQVVNVIKSKKKEKKEEINKSTLKTTQEFFTNVVASTPSSVYDDNESLAKLEINDTQKSELKILRYTNSRIKELTSIADKKKIDEKFMPKINAIISLLDKFALLDNLSPNQKNDLVEALIKIIAHDN